MADKSKRKDAPEGRISTRGSVIEGVVVSDKMQKTVTVKAEYMVKVPKYDRMKRRHTKIKARNPSEINARVGDYVRVVECRPLSKTVHFIVVEKRKSAMESRKEKGRESRKEKEQDKGLKKKEGAKKK